MATMSILFVTRKWAPAMGGMETYCLRLTERLAQTEDIQVIALQGRENGLPPSPFALLCFPITIFWLYLRRAAPPQVLHLADMALWPVGLLSAFAGGKVKVVLSAHGTDASYHRRGGFRGRLYGTYLRIGARMLRSALVIANSRATAQVLEETGWRANAIVPLATDICAPQPDQWHNGKLLFVGRLIELKGVGWFVRNVLSNLPPDINLQIAGTIWDQHEAAVLDDPRVEFLGRLDGPALTQAYRNALCVILPNIETASREYEGFGLVASEAAAAGGMVLAADHGGLRDAVIDGVTGLLIDAGKAEAWDQAIRQVMHWAPQKRLQFLLQAQARAQDYYNWDRVAEETIAAYRLESIAR